MKYVTISSTAPPPIICTGAIHLTFILSEDDERITEIYSVLKPCRVKKEDSNRYLHLKEKDLLFLCKKEPYSFCTYNRKVTLAEKARVKTLFTKLVKEKFLKNVTIPKLDDNLKIVQQWQQWGNLHENASDKLAQAEFKDEYKIIDSKYLYRGLGITKQQKAKLLSGDSISLKPSIVTSWTIDKQIAILFAQGFVSKENAKEYDNKPIQIGVVIKIPSSKANVIVNIDKLPLPQNAYSDQKEVLVRGNVLDKISIKNIVYTTWNKR